LHLILNQNIMKDLNLTSLEKKNLTKNEMNHLKGGDGEKVCGCACYYRNVGGASLEDNMTANQKGGGLDSPQNTADKAYITQDGSQRW